MKELVNCGGQLLKAEAVSDRQLKKECLKFDFVVVGGGLAGVCAAITAARQGVSVALIQDRPVLGGNASSEVRIWALGATSHMGNNNRWSREGGVIDEILTENLYRNKDGNPVILDSVILDKVLSEKNISLFLNTAVFDLVKDNNRIVKVIAFNSQNSIHYEFEGKMFCDASGDGIISYLAGASYRFGAENKEEFEECFSPSECYGRLLGHTITLYSKKSDHPVPFVAPSFALKDITKLPKFNQITPDRYGCNYWWFEYGGTMDTVHDSEKIKTELWSVVYGAWNYIKNSGNFPEADNLTLEWVGVVPGKRESRRFAGYYMLTQKDVVEQTHFEDAVAFGGWAIDLHPAQGVYSSLSSCNQYHSKGIYSIPYRCYVSKDVDNLFFAGRIISVSHVAFGSTRVMATCAHGGQAVGMSAAMCVQEGLLPKDLMEHDKMRRLQQKLNIAGQSIRNIPISPENNLLSRASVRTSSSLVLGSLPSSGQMKNLEYSAAQLLPLDKGIPYSFKIAASAEEDTTLQVEFAISSRRGNYTPDQILSSKTLSLHKGMNDLVLDFGIELDQPQYAFVIFRSNPLVSLPLSDFRATGILSVFNKFNLKVNNHGKQIPPENSGFDSFEFWCPDRRPEGQNLAMSIEPALNQFTSSELMNGFIRPTTQANAWIASNDDCSPFLEARWDGKQTISSVRLYLDTDYDHAMESVQYGHPENVIPFCVQSVTILDQNDQVLAQIQDNHQTLLDFKFDTPVVTDYLKFTFGKSSMNIPVSVFGILIN